MKYMFLKINYYIKNTILCYNRNIEGIYMYQFSLLFLKFIIFSMVGYVVEMIACAITDKQIANRGFLCGPVIPIFGVGSFLLIWMLKPFYDNVFLVIILSMLITTTIEYITALILEHIFHNKWWDYSKEKFNFQGRICLKNTLLFGFGAPFVLYILDPYSTDFLLQFKNEVVITVAIIIFVLFVADVIYSLVVAYNLRNRLIVVGDLKNEKLAKIPGMFEKMLASRLKATTKLPKRLLKAFPTLWKNNRKAFEIMKKIDLQNKKRKKKKKIS